MATSTAIPPSSQNAVNVATTGALSGDGTSGSKLTVLVDGSTIDVSGGNALEALGLLADWTVVNGKALRTDTTINHTALLQAYDVDGAAYVTFGTLKAANAPVLTISQPTGAILAIVVPSTDPHVAGAVWNNSNVLAISAG